VADARSFIQDVPISGKVKKRTTGIVGLNLLLDGGYPEGTLVMMYGTPVSGIDLAAMQFWKAEGGEEGTYFMNDGDVEVGMIDATDLHPGLYATQMAGNRIVVDSLSTIIAKYGVEEALKFLRQAREEMKKRGANGCCCRVQEQCPAVRDRTDPCGPEDQGSSSTHASPALHHHRQRYRGLDHLKSGLIGPVFHFFSGYRSGFCVIGVVDSLSVILEWYGIERSLFLLSLIKEDLKRNNANLMFILYSGVHSPMEMTRIMRVADIVIEFKTQIEQA
jgi:hypothetical protein